MHVMMGILELEPRIGVFSFVALVKIDSDVGFLPFGQTEPLL
jgi:hypothetical protein